MLNVPDPVCFLPDPMCYDKNIVRLVGKLLSAFDPDGESITTEDRQLIEDVLRYGTFLRISAVRNIPKQTLSYRFSRLLDKLEEAASDIKQNRMTSRSTAALEEKLAATERHLEKLQEECASLKEQLSRRTSHRLAVTEEKLADAERRLELSRQKCANLNQVATGTGVWV